MENKNRKNLFGNLSGAVAQSKTIEEQVKENLIILPELQRHIPPLSVDEYEQLELNLRADGCRDALIIWADDSDKKTKRYVLIDGHNRLSICTKYKIDYRIELVRFDDVEAVKDWMINNQLGKRNVTDEVRSYLRGKQYQHEKNKNTFKGNQHTEKEEQESDKPKQKTHERLAETHKVSPKTIQRDEKYVIGLDTLVKDDYDLKWKILQREIILPKNFVEAMPEKTPEEIDLIYQTLLEKRELPEEVLKAKRNKSEEPIVLPDTPQTKPKQSEVATLSKDLYTWNKWENELLQAFKKLKKKRNPDELEKIKAVIAEIEQEMK